jgi:hypothetical protein
MNKITAAAAALVVGATTAAAASTATAQTTTPSSTGANKPRAEVQVIHYIDKVDSNSNTDIDLGAPGLSVGNQQLFRDRLLRNGRQIGTSVGVAQIVALTATTLTAQVVATATLPAGQLTYQFTFTEILADGPPKVLHAAITGGTGGYRSARGECQARFIASTDDTNVRCTVILED